MHVGALAVRTEVFVGDAEIATIEAAFLRDEHLLAVVIHDVHGSGSLNVVERSGFLTFLSGRLGFGRAIYSRKTMAEFDSLLPALVIDPNLTVADAAGRAIARGPERWSEPVVLHDGNDYSIVPVVTLFRKVTDELAEQVELDALTGILNRRGFLHRLRDASDDSADDRERQVLLLIDLDGFKLVNDALGHHIGDELLRATAHRLTRAVPGAAIARMGGDEFAVLTTLETSNSLEEVALSIVQRLALPTTIAGTDVGVLASVGATAVLAGGSAEASMRRADVALYRAKGAGKNGYCVFDDEIDRDVQRQLLISQELRESIVVDSLELHYQPIVDLDSHAHVAHEGLARWTSPTLGPISPAEFIPLAERTGLIVPLGRNLLHQALRVLADPRNASFGNIHVNMSRREIHQPDLVRVLSDMIIATGVEPTRLVVEVTETSVSLDPTRMIDTLHELSELGIRIALDDFGAGATALSNLWHFPLDIVKLDKSLVEPLRQPGPEGRQGEKRIEAIIDLCHAHDLVVTAEGIEHPEQADTLRRLECDYAQGWYFGRPAPPTARAAHPSEPTRQLSDTAPSGSAAVAGP